MTKNTIIMTLVVLFIVLTGCTYQTNPDQPTDSYSEEGREGIEISFMKDAVPNKVYTNSKPNFMIEVRNSGTYSHENEATDGKIVLYGYDKSKIVFQKYPEDSKQSIDIPKLIGKSKFLPEGGYEIVSFPVERIDNVLSRTKYEPTFIATACYHYKTLATPTVCLIPETTLTERSNNVCRPKTQTFDSQSAPIAITKIEQEVLGKKTDFILTIENVGSGKVFESKEGILDKCPLALNQDNMNKVNVDLRIRVNGLEKKAECGSGNNVILINEIGTAHCSFTFDETEVSSSFTTQLVASLDYNYMTSIKKGVEIISIS